MKIILENWDDIDFHEDRKGDKYVDKKLRVYIIYGWSYVTWHIGLYFKVMGLYFANKYN